MVMFHTLRQLNKVNELVSMPSIYIHTMQLISSSSYHKVFLAFPFLAFTFLAFPPAKSYLGSIEVILHGHDFQLFCSVLYAQVVQLLFQYQTLLLQLIRFTRQAINCVLIR